MKLMQVFDCQDMPDDIRNVFYEYAEAENYCYVHVYMNDYFYWKTSEDKNDYEEYKRKMGDIINVFKWLDDNGATDEKVLIHHWW